MRINSFESFGTVDGPGVRFVIFTQGCPLRCLYCHNPDTWNGDGGATNMTPQELLVEVNKYRNFIKNGGVTVSGGEPLIQATELEEFFKLCKNDGLHTTLDTSGTILNDQVKCLLKSTDLVLLDIKSIDQEQYREITGGAELEKSFKFLDYLEAEGIKCWVRHVVVPFLTDNDMLLKKLATRLEGYTVIEKIELLPYHNFGEAKYKAMGIDYPLKNTLPVTKKRIEEIKLIFKKWV